jgi:hypothetical protein
MTRSARRAMSAEPSDLAREAHLKPTPTDREAGELLGISEWVWCAAAVIAAGCWLALILQFGAF